MIAQVATPAFGRSIVWKVVGMVLALVLALAFVIGAVVGGVAWLIFGGAR